MSPSYEDGPCIVAGHAVHLSDNDPVPASEVPRPSNGFEHFEDSIFPLVAGMLDGTGEYARETAYHLAFSLARVVDARLPFEIEVGYTRHPGAAALVGGAVRNLACHGSDRDESWSDQIALMADAAEGDLESEREDMTAVFGRSKRSTTNIATETEDRVEQLSDLLQWAHRAIETLRAREAFALVEHGVMNASESMHGRDAASAADLLAHAIKVAAEQLHAEPDRSSREPVHR